MEEPAELDIVGDDENNDIISPDCMVYQVWNVGIMVLALYTAMAYPFEIGFIDEPSQDLQYCNFFINSVFIWDIIMKFNLAFEDELEAELIYDIRRIRIRYATSWFPLDCASQVAYFVCLGLSRPLKVYAIFIMLLIMLRCWRLKDIDDLFSSLEEKVHYRFFIRCIRCTKIACVAFFIMHCAGCFVHRMATQIADDESNTWISLVSEDIELNTRGRYIMSVYYSVTTFSTVGYGDLHPVHIEEFVFSVICMVVSLGLSAYVAGKFNELFFSQPTIVTNSQVANLTTPIQHELSLEVRDLVGEHPGLSLSTFLYLAALRGDGPLVGYLLNEGAGKDGTNRKGRTTFHAAACIGSEHCVQHLLKSGATTNLKDNNGNVPLWEAIEKDHKAVINLLVKKGVKFTEEDIDQYLTRANLSGNSALYEEIDKHGPSAT